METRTYFKNSEIFKINMHKQFSSLKDFDNKHRAKFQRLKTLLKLSIELNKMNKKNLMLNFS